MALISRSLNPNRSFSLDVFRGLTLAGMILVNNPGGPQTFAFLCHKDWNGWAGADLVFPSFAFILGVALMFSLASRKAKTKWSGLSLFDYLVPISAVLLYIIKIAAQTGGFKHGPVPPLQVYDLLFPAIFIISVALPQIERRAIGKGTNNLYIQVLHHGFLIFAVGFTWSFDPTNPGGYRILGVLHRLGLVYLFAGLIVLATKRRGQIAAAAGLLALYWVVMKYLPVPNGCGTGLLTLDCNWAGYIDNLLLKGHLYRPNWDPEGLFHTVPAIASGLLGCLAGGWLREEKSIGEKMAGLFVAGNLLIVLGFILNMWFPINKNMWTPSFVILIAGIDMVGLAVCMWFVDFKGHRKPVMPFVYLGANSIFIYLISGLFMHYFSMIPGGTFDGEKIGIMKAIYVHGYAPTFGFISPYIASLALALTQVAIWMAFGAIFYKKKIFIKL
ncbi:MAG: DUF5009 domain-containing protein [bacterium]